MEGYPTHQDLLVAIDRTDAAVETIGYAPGARPILAVETGGDRQPPVLITAGAHATEHAGVCAAVALIDALDTDRRVVIVPTRDPVGLDGYDAAVALACDHTSTIHDPPSARSMLDTAGDIIHADDKLTIGCIGDYGYAITADRPDGSGTVLQRFKEYTNSAPGIFDRLAGRRVFTTSGSDKIDAADPYERSYTIVIDPRGRPMHLNRFFTDRWAPVETRSLRGLFADLEPVLTIDCHETTAHANRFHVSLRPQKSTAATEREAALGRAIVDAVSARDTPIATDADVLGEPTKTVAHTTDDKRPADGFYRKSSRGAYWVDPHATDPPRLGEGLNAVDYAADQYGLAVTLETGMGGSLEQRTGDAIAAVRAAIAFLD